MSLPNRRELIAEERAKKTEIKLRQGEWMRNSYLLTNTWQLAGVRVASRSDKGLIERMAAGEARPEEEEKKEARPFDATEWHDLAELFIKMRRSWIPHDAEFMKEMKKELKTNKDLKAYIEDIKWSVVDDRAKSAV